MQKRPHERDGKSSRVPHSYFTFHLAAFGPHLQHHAGAFPSQEFCHEYWYSTYLPRKNLSQEIRPAALPQYNSTKHRLLCRPGRRNVRADRIYFASVFSKLNSNYLFTLRDSVRINTVGPFINFKQSKLIKTLIPFSKHTSRFTRSAGIYCSCRRSAFQDYSNDKQCRNAGR